MRIFKETPNFTIWYCEDNDNVDANGVLYFEHDEYGDECGGKIWVVDGYIEDYDGVYTLPEEIFNEFMGYM